MNKAYKGKIIDPPGEEPSLDKIHNFEKLFNCAWPKLDSAKGKDLGNVIICDTAGEIDFKEPFWPKLDKKTVKHTAVTDAIMESHHLKKP
jgi:hypothetical protein